MSFDEENFDEFVTFRQIRQNFPSSEIYAVRYCVIQETTSRMMELSEAPKGYNSVHGVKNSDEVSSDFKGDEYSIYSTSQQRIRYSNMCVCACACECACAHVCFIVYTYYDVYRIAGKFGGGKVWWIWRITRGLPNLNHPNFFTCYNNKLCNAAVGIRQTFFANHFWCSDSPNFFSPPNIPAIRYTYNMLLCILVS